MAKNKVRTRKGVAKRFKVTAGGKVLHRSHLLRHLRAKKSKKRLRRMKQMKETVGVHGKKVRQMLGRA